MRPLSAVALPFFELPSLGAFLLERRSLETVLFAIAITPLCWRLCIGNLNQLFSGPSNSAGPAGCQFPFCLMKNAGLLWFALGVQRAGGDTSVPDRTVAHNQSARRPGEPGPTEF